MDKLTSALVVATFAAGACAQLPTPGVSDAEKSNLTTGTVEDTRSFNAIVASRQCVAQTGTHIVRKGACVNAPGRSYGSADLESTGALNPGEALILLEPAITLTPR